MSVPQLAKVWTDCTRCGLHKGRDRSVIGAGPVPARLIVIGEAPDKHDNGTGSPFGGAVGNFLRAEATAAGLDLSSAFVTHLVACHPPQNRIPMYDELAACQPRLHALFQYVQPECALLLGGAAAVNLLGFNGITKHRGKWKDIKWKWKGEERLLPAMATFHPGAMMSSRNPNPKELEKFKADLAAMAARLAGEPA